jgi:His-Xaa-Ser system protein HxsD
MADINRLDDAGGNPDQESPIEIAERGAPLWLGADGTVAFSLDRAVYSRTAVLATAYQLSDKHAVLLDSEGDSRWALFVIGTKEATRRELVARVLAELADQALRERLEGQFGDIRTLIVAQAFAEGDLLEADEPSSINRGDSHPARKGR